MGRVRAAVVDPHHVGAWLESRGDDTLDLVENFLAHLNVRGQQPVQRRPRQQGCRIYGRKSARDQPQ